MARTVAFVLFEGVEELDFVGPWEVFTMAGMVVPGEVTAFTVAERSGLVKCAKGLQVVAEHDFESCPKADIVLVPGGNATRTEVDNKAMIAFLARMDSQAEYTTSVCTGALLLERAGVLEGLRATTHWSAIEMLKKTGTETVENARFVDNGRVITTAGLSSGIDGSLHVIERLFGKGTAQMAALGMEYNWDPDSKFVRAMLADKYLRFNYDVKVVEGGWRPLSRSGSTDKWENTWAVTTESTANELFETVNSSIAANRVYGPTLTKWTRTTMAPTKDTMQSSWTFNDEKGTPWTGVVTVIPVAGQKNQYTLSVKVERGNSRTTTSSL